MTTYDRLDRARRLKYDNWLSNANALLLAIEQSEQPTRAIARLMTFFPYGFDSIPPGPDDPEEYNLMCDSELAYFSKLVGERIQSLKSFLRLQNPSIDNAAAAVWQCLQTIPTFSGRLVGLTTMLKDHGIFPYAQIPAHLYSPVPPDPTFQQTQEDHAETLNIAARVFTDHNTTFLLAVQGCLNLLNQTQDPIVRLALLHTIIREGATAMVLFNISEIIAQLPVSEDCKHKIIAVLSEEIYEKGSDEED